MPEKRLATVKKKPAEVELITTPEEDPVITAEGMATAMDLIEENLKGEQISPRNFPKASLLAAGALGFQLESAAGTQVVNTLSGVVVAARGTRAYWKKAFSPDRTAEERIPDCISTDTIIGRGDPGGACHTCPNNKFNTAIGPHGEPKPGKACREARELLIKLHEDLLPHLFRLPVTSIQNWLRYSVQLVTAGFPHWGVVTKLTPVMADAGGGIKYAEVVFTIERRLSPEQRALLRPYSRQMKDFLRPMEVDTTLDPEAAVLPEETASDIQEDEQAPF
jgi:hypothetical protein